MTFEWLHLNLRSRSGSTWNCGKWLLRKSLWLESENLKLCWERRTFVWFQPPSCRGVRLLSQDWIYVATFPLPFQVFFVFVFLVWDQHEDHWLSSLSLPEPKDNDLSHVLSSVGRVCPRLLALFSQGRKIQSQSNCKILTELEPGRGYLSIAKASIDHFCDKDWKENRK